jgi:hypothetical protein
MLFVIEEGVKLDDVGVVEVGLDFYLTDQLIDETDVGGKQLFCYLFDCADKVRDYMAELRVNYRARYTDPNCPYYRNLSI